MNNAEKFKEVFGFMPDTETMIPICPPRGVECPFMDDGIYSECHCELWWGREYKAPDGKDAYIKGYEDGVKSVNICPHCGEYIGAESEGDNGN